MKRRREVSYCRPHNSLVLPPAYYIISPSNEPELIFYDTVQAGNVTGRDNVFF